MIFFFFIMFDPSDVAGVYLPKQTFITTLSNFCICLRCICPYMCKNDIIYYIFIIKNSEESDGKYVILWVLPQKINRIGNFSKGLVKIRVWIVLLNTNEQFMLMKTAELQVETQL